MMSGLWSQNSSTGLEACYKTMDKEGITVEAALKKIGYLGDTPCDYRQNGLESYFELHIEQGPKLELAKKSVGIVTAVQGMKWFVVRVAGVEGHSGITPMDARSDAMVTAARLIAAVNDTAKSNGLGVATVGVITNDTQAQSTIPNGVEFIIDARCSTDQMVDNLCTAIFKSFDDIVKKEDNETAYHIVRSYGVSEAVFHADCIEAVRAAAIEEAGMGQIMDMKSGAGHDVAWASKVVKSSMIFVISKDGLSHNPNEYSSPKDCELGAQVSLQSVMRYDEGVKSGSLP